MSIELRNNSTTELDSHLYLGFYKYISQNSSSGYIDYGRLDKNMKLNFG